MTEPERVEEPSHVRGLIVAMFAILPVAAVVFLLASKFLVAWDGRVTGVAPTSSEATTSYRVLIVDEAGDGTMRVWPAEVVEPLGVPIDPILVPPATVDQRYPRTSKQRFQLHFLVEQPGGESAIVPTTTPQALALAAMVWLVLLAMRNAYVSGSPIDIRPRPTVLPAPLAPPGQVASTTQRKGQYQPPPPRGSKKRGRR